MQALPIPDVPTRVYAGVKGPRGRYSPFGDVFNDGILDIHETTLLCASSVEVQAMHTFIMLNQGVARDIIQMTRSL